MSTPRTIEFRVHFTRGRSGKRELHIGERAELPQPRQPKPRRVAKLMALAIYLDDQLRRGVYRDYAHIASVAQVSRARVSQIMDLLFLAPDLQKALIMHEPRAARWTERTLRMMPRHPDWQDQREILNRTPELVP